MFGVDTTELLIVALAALIFIGPKELPAAMRTVGRWVGQARAHARHFTSGIENMMREAELEEMEQRWRAENERIMRDHPAALPYVGAELPGGEGGEGASTSLGTNGDEFRGEMSRPPFVQRQVDGPMTPASPTDPDEPPLPLPEPEHHRRELP